ncbi:MAG: hypothetical protein M1827_007295 [Pycnora praestabilis]|nr:MAG: hypothetical protein M1827_007295 [Pycnora praestabilis]
MTTRYTDEEWTSIIRSARETLSDADMMYKAPTLGSEEFTKSIDHQLLNMDARKEDVDRLCEEARTWKFNVRMYFDSELCVFGPCCGDLTDGREQSVCVRPHHVARAVGNLKGSRISVASVVGFHEGTQSMTEKVAEARKAIKDGASEVHMVLNRPLLQGGEYSAAYTDIAAIRSTAPHPIIVGLILETSQLSKGDVVAACKIAAHSKVDFLDTCTTIDGIGTTEDNVRLMKDVVRGQGIKINASGNVQTLRDAVLMLEAGADRLGTTAGISILKEARARVDGLTHSAGFAPSADIARLQRSQHEGDGWLASPSPPVGKPQTKQYFPSS